MNTPNPGDISFSGNTLRVGGEVLRMGQVTPDTLHSVLTMGRSAIISHIEALYAQTSEVIPDATVVRPSITAVQLSPNGRQVEPLSDYGIRNRTNIHLHQVELATGESRALWEAVADAQFTPEARRFRPNRGPDAVTLGLRNPETDPAPVTTLDNLPRALGFIEPGLFATIRESYPELDMSARMQLARDAFEAGQTAVSNQAASYPNDPDVYPRAQLGLSLAVANMRVEMYGAGYTVDPDAYVGDLAEISEGAYQLGLDEIDACIQAEISRIAVLQSR